MRKYVKLLAFVAAVAACSDDISLAQPPPFTVTPVAEFREPWAMAFLPDGRLLVTEKRGALKLHDLTTARPRTSPMSRPSSTRGKAVSATSCCIPTSPPTASST